MIFKATLDNKAHPEYGQASMTLEELMRDDPAERYQQEMEERSQGQTMC